MIEKPKRRRYFDIRLVAVKFGDPGGLECLVIEKQRPIIMTDLDQLKQELPRLRELAGSVCIAEAATWSASEHARFKSEIKCCTEA